MNYAHVFKEEGKAIEDYEDDIKGFEEANKYYYKEIMENEKKNIFQRLKDRWDYGFGESAFERLSRGIDNNNETIRGIQSIIQQKKIDELYHATKERTK